MGAYLRFSFDHALETTLPQWRHSVVASHPGKTHSPTLPSSSRPVTLRPRQQLGKYRIVRRLASGGFAQVYKARDTVEGIGVALKIPHAHLVTTTALEEFKREARVVAQLDHPNIVGLKNAGPIDDHFVIVYPLGKETLGERLRKRPSLTRRLSYAEQLLAALTHAHKKKIIHCDVKPENLLLYEEDRLRLMDFGISKVAAKTLQASGSGTVGYVAPEQALGRPSVRSDVFSAGLILYRMFSGVLPTWPYDWPPKGHATLRRNLSAGMVDLIAKAIEVDERRRWKDAGQMLTAFRRLKPKALSPGSRRRKRPARGKDWKEHRQRQFARTFGKSLGHTASCGSCGGQVAMTMGTCPWCGTARKRQVEQTDFPANCPRCRRGWKLDWTWCPWCWGAAAGPLEDRSYSDRRYSAHCESASCEGPLMPFMRYCPWCHTKLKTPWALAGSNERCSGCGWGVAGDYWSHCPWCAKSLGPGTGRGP